MPSPGLVTGNLILDFLVLLFNGISEVCLISSSITGIFILVGVFIASRKASVVIVVFGLIGATLGLVLGAPYSSIALGLLGYNSILTGMNWLKPFVNISRATFVLSLFAAAFTAVVDNDFCESA